MRLLALVSTVVVMVTAVFCFRSSDSEALQVAAVGGEPIPLAFGAVHPKISPDGKTVAFSYQGAICRMPREGGPIAYLTQEPGFDTEPAWSPDGQHVAFARSPNFAGGQLHIIDAWTQRPVRLPKRVIARGAIAYSKLEYHPDAKRILGIFNADGKDHGLSWFNIETGELKTLVAPDRWGRYALSTKGDKVAFTRMPNVAGQQGGNDGWHSTILTVPSDGGEPEEIGVFPARIHDLCFVAGDRSLFVAADLGGPMYDLWEVPLTDGKVNMATARQLTFGQGDEHRPSISRDGRWLLYTDNREGATRLTARHLPSGHEKPVIATNVDYLADNTRTRVRIVDATDDKQRTVRVSLERNDGKFHAPPGSLYRILGSNMHFYCDGNFETFLPNGEYQMRVYRGPEYKPTYKEFTVGADRAVEIETKIHRWTNPAGRGWYSGENHIHANYGYGEWYNSPETMLEQSSGEAINVSNFMVANSDGDGIFDRRYFRGGLDPRSTDDTLLYWNQEFRSTIWGHMTLVNLSQLVEPIMTGFKDTTNPWDIPTNSDIARRTRLQNGLVNYTHVAQRPEDPYLNPYTGKSIPVDVALGNIDSLDLNASYAGTVPLWYRLLNCGFRLTASAGTDCFLNRIRSRLPGGDRVYVKIDGELTYDKWIEGLRAGRSIVTNGPQLQFTAGGKEIGDTIRLAGEDRIQVTAKVEAQFPLDRLEVIHNGKVIATMAANGKRLNATIEQQLPVTESGWFAVRATGPGHPDHPIGIQYAHTSPIYVEIAGKPAGSKEDAEYFLKWIARLSLAVRVRDRIPSDELKKHVDDQFEAARDVYRKIAKRR